MYVCVCNAVTDGQVRQCLDQGLNSLATIKRQLEFKSCCGRCSCHIREMICEHACCAELQSPLDSPFDSSDSSDSSDSYRQQEQPHAR